MTDITTLAAADTGTITLKHPVTGQPLDGCTVTLYGPGTEQYAAAEKARNQRMLDSAATVGRKGRVDQDAAARLQVTYLAACTHSISGWDYKGGTGPDAIAAAYGDRKLGWIADQVAAALGDWATFLPTAPTN